MRMRTTLEEMTHLALDWTSSQKRSRWVRMRMRRVQTEMRMMGLKLGRNLVNKMTLTARMVKNLGRLTNTRLKVTHLLDLTDVCQKVTRLLFQIDSLFL